MQWWDSRAEVGFCGLYSCQWMWVCRNDKQLRDGRFVQRVYGVVIQILVVATRHGSN